MGNKAIYTYINGRKTFVGKQINDVIHREFDFSKAVLWQNKELSFDERLLLYAQNQKIKSFRLETLFAVMVDGRITGYSKAKH